MYMKLRVVPGGQNGGATPFLTSVLLWFSKQQECFDILTDQVAKAAPNKFSTIDSTSNQNPRIAHENLRCCLYAT